MSKPGRTIVRAPLFQAGIAAVLLLLLAPGAPLRAATAPLLLQPSADSAAPGTSLSIALQFDAGDAPGSRPGLFGGEIIVDFDPLLLAYEGFVPQGSVSLYSGPVSAAAGDRQTIQLGFENAPDAGTVGLFSFLVLSPPGPLPPGGLVTQIGLADADDFFGSFVSYVPTDQAFYPEFTGTSITVVPGPAAVWLLASAVGLLLGWSRRAAAVRTRARCRIAG